MENIRIECTIVGGPYDGAKVVVELPYDRDVFSKWDKLDLDHPPNPHAYKVLDFDRTKNTATLLY